MVRRLVEEQKIRLAKQRLRQRDPRLLPAGKMGDPPRQIVVGKAQPEGHPADTAFVIVALELLEALDDPAVLRHRRFIRPICDRFFQRPFSFPQPLDVGESLAELLVQRPRPQRRLLLCVADRRRNIETYPSRVALLLTQKAAQKRRLARAVRSDQPGALAFRDPEIHIMKKLRRAKGFFKPLRL